MDFFSYFLNVINRKKKKQTSVSQLPVIIYFIVFSSRTIERIPAGKLLYEHILHINPSKESENQAGVPKELAHDISEPGGKATTLTNT